MLNDKVTCSNADLKADMERWHKKKRQDLRRFFMDAADRQIQYYEKVSPPALPSIVNALLS